MATLKLSGLPSVDSAVQSGRDSPVLAKEDSLLDSLTAKIGKMTLSDQAYGNSQYEKRDTSGGFSVRLRPVSIRDGTEFSNTSDPYTRKQEKNKGSITNLRDAGCQVDSEFDITLNEASKTENAGSTIKIVAAVAIVALVAAGAWFVSQGISVNSKALTDCMAAKDGIANKCAISIQDAVERATSKANQNCEGLKLESYRSGTADCKIIHGFAAQSVDQTLGVQIPVPGTNDTSTLEKMLPVFVEEIEKQILENSPEAMPFLGK